MIRRLGLTIALILFASGAAAQAVEAAPLGALPGPADPQPFDEFDCPGPGCPSNRFEIIIEIPSDIRPSGGTNRAAAEGDQDKEERGDGQ